MLLKKPLRNIVSNSLALYFAPYVIQGFTVENNLYTIAMGGFVLSLVNFFVKPILKTISFPINLITLGTFNIIINGILLYLVIYVIDGIKATAGAVVVNIPAYFNFELNLPEIGIIIAASLTISLVNWLLRKILL